MRFNDIYPNATVLTEEWLKKEYSLIFPQLTEIERDNLFRKYYIDMCAAINQLHYGRFSPTQVENLLNNPKLGLCGCNGLYTAIIDPQERKYNFLRAMAEQLLFDKTNGRTSILRGEDKKWNVAWDAKVILDQLGFCQRTYAVKW